MKLILEIETTIYSLLERRATLAGYTNIQDFISHLLDLYLSGLPMHTNQDSQPPAQDTRPKLYLYREPDNIHQSIMITPQPTPTGKRKPGKPRTRKD